MLISSNWPSPTTPCLPLPSPTFPSHRIPSRPERNRASCLPHLDLRLLRRHGSLVSSQAPRLAPTHTKQRSTPTPPCWGEGREARAFKKASSFNSKGANRGGAIAEMPIRARFPEGGSDLPPRQADKQYSFPWTRRSPLCASDALDRPAGLHRPCNDPPNRGRSASRSLGTRERLHSPRASVTLSPEPSCAGTQYFRCHDVLLFDSLLYGTSQVQATAACQPRRRVKVHAHNTVHTYCILILYRDIWVPPTIYVRA